jgi:hypothetical protein
MTAITQTKATDGQIRQIKRFGSDAIDKALNELNLEKSEAQSIIENGNLFTKSIHETALASIKKISIPVQSPKPTYFKAQKKKVICKNGYHSNCKPKKITEQIYCLRKFFPDIGITDKNITYGELPKEAEGWFAIPRWQSIGLTYYQATERMLYALKENLSERQSLINFQFSQNSLRQTEKSEKIIKKICRHQEDNDILIIPAQLGFRYCGYSVYEAREIFSENEFGLGAFAIAAMLLTHPERLLYKNSLSIDCAGDEYITDPTDYEYYARAPVFCFRENSIEFGSNWVGRTNKNFGSATGFLIPN